jgi:hypothetical protein
LRQERVENMAKLAVASGDLGSVHGVFLLVGSGGEFSVGKSRRGGEKMQRRWRTREKRRRC